MNHMALLGTRFSTMLRMLPEGLTLRGILSSGWRATLDAADAR